MSSTRLIGFYLPQYHPIQENDTWWGRGFTEWTNVAKARPKFPGHYQPHLPADLGFYDLRLDEVRERQAMMARDHGIHGFCYYHYWSQGNRLLERPFSEVLATGKPDFPFCLCWANENWTRRWDGMDQHVLWQMTYSEDDDRRHMEWLCHAFRDERYIRIDGKPLFLVYRTCNLPDARQTAMIWRETAERAGVGEICLANVESLLSCHRDPEEIGFDIAVEFQPAWKTLKRKRHTRKDRALLHIKRPLAAANIIAQYQENIICDYADYVRAQMRRPVAGYPKIPCVTPSWDNSARHPDSRAIILDGATPSAFSTWLLDTLRNRKFISNCGDQFVFVNAWNEWAEGAHLEPCQRWGRQYLEAVRRSLNTIDLNDSQSNVALTPGNDR